MKYQRKMKVESKIPSASMADIAFLLIVFFMVTTTFSKDKTTVNLPKSQYRVEIPKNATIISIKEDLSIHFDGDPITLTDIYPRAALLIKDNPHKQFVIKCDEKVKYRYLDDVLDQLREAKVVNINLPTLQEIEE